MRMLIVEDDQDSREMLAELFRLHDWTVTAVGTTREAMEELNRDGFDLVISDEDLVGESGSGMLRKAFADGLLSSGSGVMMYTAEPGKLDVPPGVRVLRKPLGFSQLLTYAERFAPPTSTPSTRSGRAPANDDRVLERAAPPSSGARPVPSAASAAGAREGDGVASTKEPRVELVLYVTDSPSSQRALANLERILEGIPKDRVSVDIHHLDRQPADAEASIDRVGLTPMLVKRGPGPQERFVGDLNSAPALVALLRADDEPIPSSRAS